MGPLDGWQRSNNSLPNQATTSRASAVGFLALGGLVASGGFKAIPFVAASPVDITLTVTLVACLATGVHLLGTGFTVRRGSLLPSLMLAAIVPSLLISSWSPDSVYKMALFFSFSAACLILPGILYRQSGDAVWLYRILVVAGVVLALALVTTQVILPGAGLLRFGAFGGSVLHVANLAGAAAVILLVPTLIRRRGSGVTFIIAGITVAGVFISGTRTAVVGVALAVAAAAMAGDRQLSTRRFLSRILPGFVAMAIVGLLLAPIQARNRLARVLTQGTEDASLSVRLTAWRESAAETATRPFGVGFGDWQYEVATTSTLEYPHNLVIEVISEAGWLAAGILVWLLTTALRRAWAASHDLEGRVLFGLLVFAISQACFRGDITDQRLLFVLVSLALVIGPHPKAPRSAPEDPSAAARVDDRPHLREADSATH